MASTCCHSAEESRYSLCYREQSFPHETHLRSVLLEQAGNLMTKMNLVVALDLGLSKFVPIPDLWHRCAERMLWKTEEAQKGLRCESEPKPTKIGQLVR